MSFSSVYYQFLSKLKRFISLIIVLPSKHCKKYKIDADIDVKYGAQCTSWDTVAIAMQCLYDSRIY